MLLLDIARNPSFRFALWGTVEFDAFRFEKLSMLIANNMLLWYLSGFRRLTFENIAQTFIIFGDEGEHSSDAYLKGDKETYSIRNFA